ncbi:MAG: O-antigen ligase family protein, partial [Anaerolineales bacterium]|nr:O-antigen ligase family protein [Anaerolineales bacterium]
MQTKLGLFCDKIIEAGWLTAAIVTPLFFNWYSNRVFEASKVALLRSITVVMLAAWLIKALEKGLSGERQNGKPATISLRTPLIMPVLFFVGAYLLSTMTSVSPRVSFWGSYHRRQGLYVIICYIAIFFSMLKTLRTRQQLERLITVILITSLPASLYGIMQHYEVDPLVWVRPLSWMGRIVQRVESTLGNPILIGAYLIMVVPLTVWQIVRFFSLVRTKGKKAGRSLVLFGCYVLLLLLQLICLVLTQSRGPVMGLMSGVLFFFLLWAALRGRRGLALAAVGVSIALFTILAILNLPNTPLSFAEEMPYVQRLTAIYKDIMYDRSLIWSGAVNMMTADRIRTVIGYGPESMGLIFYPYMHPDWAAMKGYQEIADRCHNETLDTWVTGGLIGLSAYLLLFSSIFYYGLKWLGLIANSRQRTFFVITCLAGGGSGVLIPWLIDGTLRWAGLGIPAGILLALVIYLLASLFNQNPTSHFQPPTSNFQLPTSNLQPPTSNLQPPTSNLQ